MIFLRAFSLTCSKCNIAPHKKPRDIKTICTSDPAAADAGDRSVSAQEKRAKKKLTSRHPKKHAAVITPRGRKKKRGERKKMEGRKKAALNDYAANYGEIRIGDGGIQRYECKRY